MSNSATFYYLLLTFVHWPFTFYSKNPFPLNQNRSSALKLPGEKICKFLIILLLSNSWIFTLRSLVLDCLISCLESSQFYNNLGGMFVGIFNSKKITCVLLISNFFKIDRFLVLFPKTNSRLSILIKTLITFPTEISFFVNKVLKQKSKVYKLVFIFAYLLIMVQLRPK